MANTDGQIVLGLDIPKTIKQINADIKKLQNQLAQIKANGALDTNSTVKQINTQIAALQSQLKTININAEIDANTANKAAQQTGSNIAQNIASGISQANDKVNAEVQKLADQVNKIQFSLDNGYGVSESQNRIKSLINDFQKYGVAAETAKSQTNSLQQILNNSVNLHGLGRLGQTLKDQMSQAAQSFTQCLSISSAVMHLVSETQNAISELKEIDTLLTEISKANDTLTKSQLSEIRNNAFDVASKYGKTATDYLTGVQEMSRAGYENADSMAELSAAAQCAGDITAELANQYIIATDVAFKMNGSIAALTSALDGANNITNHNAVNMTELAEGISVVGTQAASSQMEVNEITAAIGTMVATTQKSGSEMGNAFKGILMNLQQVSGDVGDGEDIIDAEALTKYEKACAELGVSLKEVKNGIVSLKEPRQILKELSEEYAKLDEADAKRTNLLSAVGGKYRANALNAILENYDLYEKMLQDYADGMGSMAIKAEKTANSWEGSMSRLGNTWKDTIENIANSDAIITVINSLNSILSVVNNVTDKLGSFGTIGLGAGLFAGVKNTGKCRISVRIS